MKQRVGIARALVGGPELLCMDEPFSALDVLTAELLRSEVYRLWSEGKTGLSSIVLITHLIDEAVFLGDRIIVLGANPGTVRREIVNRIPHPREYHDPEFLRMVSEIHDVVTRVHLPEEPEPAPVPAGVKRPAVGPVAPIPVVRVGEILGLLEIVADHSGSIDLFALDAETVADFGKTIAIVKGAELLDLVDTPKNLVVLTDLGRALLAEGPEERRHLFKTRLITLGLFAELVRWLAQDPDQPRTERELRDFLAARFPNEPLDELLHAVVDWGRYGMLLDYDANAGEVSLWAGRAPEDRE
jgi:NitT/TauT family transport system ATP-binding protein